MAPHTATPPYPRLLRATSLLDPPFALVDEEALWANAADLPAIEDFVFCGGITDGASHFVAYGVCNGLARFLGATPRALD